MTRRRAPRPAPPAAPTQYWLLATGAELARLLAGEVAAALRTQAIRHLKREPFESDALYLARLADVEATREPQDARRRATGDEIPVRRRSGRRERRAAAPSS